MAASDIEWTDEVWNPVRGCTKISPGCKHCYAEAFAERWRGVPGHPYERGFDPRLAPEKLGEPLTWNRPRRVFVNSMSDLFMDEVPDAYVAAVFGVMAASPRHTFQVLTKRARRLPEWFRWADSADIERLTVLALDAVGVETGCGSAFDPDAWPLPNVHLGVSVEDRRYGLPRVEHLRATPAALRFLSVEPLLEDLGDINLDGIGWVIVGGESGQRARECDVAAVRRVVEQCRDKGVPVFVKQLGRLPMIEGKRLRLYVEGGKPDAKGKSIGQWPKDLQVREFPR